MAYTAPPAKIAGDTLTEANWNTHIKDNFEAGVPDIFTSKGDIAAATGADAAARVAAGANDSIIVYDSGEAAGLIAQTLPSCRVYNAANIDPATGSWVTLTFNTERFDTDAMHSIVANTSRITVPAGGDGIYLIGANVVLDTSGDTAGSNWAGLRLYLNGATVIAQEISLKAFQAPGTDIAMQISTIYSLAYNGDGTDYVEVQVYTQGNYDVVSIGNYSPVFWAIWQRRP